MRKELFLTPLCSLAISGVIQADTVNSDLYLFLGGTSITSSVSTSMHDSGSAAASYTLGSAGNSAVQTTTGYSSSGGVGGNSAAYEESKYDSSSSGSSSRPRSTGGSSAIASGGGTGEGGSKGGIPVAFASAEASPIVFTIEGGYQSDYVYHGLSQIEAATASAFGANGSGMYFAGVNATWKGLSAGLKYVRSEQALLNPRFHPSGGKHTTYEEYVLDINYTLGLISGPQGAGNWLDLTVGYQMLYFTEETFWNTDTQHELYARLRVNRYQWLRPSISYHQFEQGDTLDSPADTLAPKAQVLEGNQIILQVDGSGQIYDAGNAQIGVGYYAQIGYDKGYNGASSSFEHDWVQYGVSFPVTLGNVVVTPSVNYTDRSDPGISNDLWWGLKVGYSF